MFDGVAAELLSLSASTPWGIVTSIFIHANKEHLYSNVRFLGFLTLIGTFVFLGLYSTVNQPLKMVKRWVWSYILTILISHLATSAIQYFQISSDIRFMGMSLIVFGLLGYTLASIFSLVASWIISWFRWKMNLSKPYRLLWLGLLTLIFSEIFTLIVFYLFGVAFFAGKVGGEVLYANVQGHLYAFIIGKFLGSSLMVAVYRDNV
jgi:hypothetical protein